MHILFHATEDIDIFRIFEFIGYSVFTASRQSPFLICSRIVTGFKQSSFLNFQTFTGLLRQSPLLNLQDIYRIRTVSHLHFQ